MSMTMEWNIEQFEQIDKELVYLKSHAVRVGVLGHEITDGVSIQDYAVWNEYGTLRIPSRPFFRKALATRKAQREITELMQSLFNELIQGGKTGEQMLRIVGEYCKARLIESIKGGGWESNKASTLKYKNQSQPLIDTTTLISSIYYMIEGV